MNTWWNSSTIAPLLQVLDIGLVAYLLYRVLMWVRGTPAAQVIRGIIVLGLATFVVNNFLHLPTLGWLLRTFWMAWAVVLAVVFQPELRALLARLGSHRLGRALIPHESRVIDEIVAAVREASRNRIGFLIVMEQGTGLRNYIATGTPVNGMVTSDLLLTIFYPHTLLHDGAVVIRNDRIVAAGCVLPLSNAPDIARVMGTRHRAALGLTEITDAVVLVVSEETGTVSWSQEGRLDRDVTPEDLKERLLKLYRSVHERGFFERRMK